MSAQTPRRAPIRVTGLRSLTLAAVLALHAGACGSGLSGTWATSDGQGRLEFDVDGTVYLTSYGGTFACRYQLDGDHVIITGPNGSQVFTRQGNQLEAGLGMVFVRR
ncbi:MAG TPA: hypothetical protein VFY71_06180 [Planctomycetota bacterium]|nr:hypothetical protein [Planctomycetota bacterium]